MLLRGKGGGAQSPQVYTEVTEFLKELFLFKHNFTRIRFDVSWFKFLNHDNKMIRLVKMCVQLKLTIIDI